VSGLVINVPVLTLGLATGMAYGLLAVGLVLVYRSDKVINFAHGEIGAFGAAVFGLAIVKWHVWYWAALPFALALSAAIAAVTEVGIIRRLRNAPKLMSLVATLGLAQFLLSLSQTVNSSAQNGATFPQPTGLPSFRIDTFLVTKAYVGLLVVSPFVVLGLVLFLRYSRYGLSMRAAAANPEAARMAGVFAGRMSTMAWAIAGAVACLTAILLKPTLGFVTAQALGPNLLLRALAAAVLARMTSLPIALGAGIGVGVVEQVLLRSYPTSGFTEVVLFVGILVTLLFQSRGGGRAQEKDDWSRVMPWPPLSARLRASGFVSRLGSASGLTMMGVFLVIPLFATNQTATTLIIILAVTIIGLSLGIVTGLGGQLSLGQFAIAGVGAAVSYHVVDATGAFPLAFLVAGIAGAGVSVLIGLPALRIKGLLLAVTTLAFAIACERFFFQQSWLLGGGVEPGRPVFGSFAFDTGKRYYLFGLVVFALCMLLCRNVWRSGMGRRLRALRDNEDGARAFSIPATRVKLETFAVAGFVAGVGGALFGHTFARIQASDFTVTANINIVAFVVVGGIGLLAGPLLGAMYVIGIPQFIPLSSAALAASAFGWLVLILYFPGGIAQLVRPIRDYAVRIAAREEDRDLPVEVEPEDNSAAAKSPLDVSSPALTTPRRAGAGGQGETLLEVHGLAKRFGGVRAVDGVDLTVRRGETLGLIGPNGAGKTTLFEMLGGFTRPDIGRVVFAGADISRLRPEQRAKLGVVRSFQDAGLFPTLTVLETVQLALEREAPTSTVASLMGRRGADRTKEERARALINLMGLEPYIDKQTGDLSTGTRRITELTCVIALEPTLLLLDEPSSGVAQRETEQLAELLEKVKAHLGATLIVIEHDMPLIMGISNRIVAMDSGRILAEGTPAEVIADPLVLESYLGGNAIAVERSGVRPAAKAASAGRCSAATRSGSACSRAAVRDGYCSQHAGALVGAP
jgi:ABC-type branched-subunit amino acid transport system ATPase component/branched-subunit amino acid ABC-type transport system permease component